MDLNADSRGPAAFANANLLGPVGSQARGAKRMRPTCLSVCMAAIIDQRRLPHRLDPDRRQCICFYHPVD